MSVPTVANIYTAARGHLGDDENSAGEIFTDAKLQGFYKHAYAELFAAYERSQLPFVVQEAIYNLPAYTGFLDPATAGIISLGEIESVWERGGVTAIAVTAATAGAASLSVTAAAHGRATGNQIALYGLGGITLDHTGLWIVTVSSSSIVLANGCTATGTYTSGGTLSYSSEDFTEMSLMDRFTDISGTVGDSLGRYSRTGDKLKFPPALGVRQLRIFYKLSGAAPTTTTASVGIDDSLHFLGLRTAGLAAQARNMLQRAAIINNWAVGPAWDSAGVAGGALANLLDNGVRNLQNLPQDQLRSRAKSTANIHHGGIV